MIEPTEEMVKEFRRRALADGEGIEAGLAAVLAIVERDYDVRCGKPYTGDYWAHDFRCDRPAGHEGDHEHSDGDHAVSWP